MHVVVHFKEIRDKKTRRVKKHVLNVHGPFKDPEEAIAWLSRRRSGPYEPFYIRKVRKT